MDIAQNSIVANANQIGIDVTVDEASDSLCVTVDDNGKGMSEEALQNLLSPFSTSRTTRKVGLGIPMFKETATAAGGNFDIASALGKGTRVTANMLCSHIDRPPLGAFAETMHIIITANPKLDFAVCMKNGKRCETLDTKEVKAVLGGVALDNPEVSMWILENLKEMKERVFGGLNI